MNLSLPKILLIYCLLCPVNKLFAQQSPILSLTENSDKIIDQIKGNASINADSAYKLLSNWSAYPVVKQTGIDYLYYYTDPTYGKIPLRIYIPTSYKSENKSPCILLLHGATGGSKFEDIDTLSKFNDDIIFSYLKKQEYIIIRPVADRQKNFNWSVTNFDGNPNPIFKILTDVLSSVKRILNIDDNKVFAYGHSDGSDGTIGLGVYSPNQFAGLIAYNSMLNNIFARDFYIRNIVNTPSYIVHSDLDDLRPIQQTRVIVDSLIKINAPLLYKEYIGYQHYDKHLDKDMPYSMSFMKSQSRNPYKTNVYWETDKTDTYNSCHWLQVTGIDTSLKAAPWHSPLNFQSYNKKNKTWMPYPYYSSLEQSAAVKAYYNNNIFHIETSDVKEIELLISPVMVNLENPVIVYVNGKQVFSGKVLANKDFLLKGFKENFDKQALWVNAVKIKIAQ